jgi:hypothetical protein
MNYLEFDQEISSRVLTISRSTLLDYIIRLELEQRHPVADGGLGSIVGEGKSAGK